MLILTFLAVLAIVLSSCCLLIHIHQHFRLRTCLHKSKIFKSRTSTSNINTVAGDTKQCTTASEVYVTKYICQTFIVPVDDEDFDFFPFTFVPYCIFTLTIILLILYRLISIKHFDNEYDYDEINFIEHIMIDLGNKYSDSDDLFSFNIIDLYFQTYNKHTNGMTTIDVILMHSMVVLSVWDSLFSFYRYFTTVSSATRFKISSTKKVLKYFSLYAVPYFSIYLVQLHVYYILFPLLILSHLTFNIWCNVRFSKILIDSMLKFSSSDENNFMSTAHDDMLKSVQFIRRTSIIWCIISSLCQGLFMITYHIETIYFYPILWSIGIICFTVNFARNRGKIYQDAFMLFQSFKHCFSSAVNTPKSPSLLRKTKFPLNHNAKIQSTKLSAPMILHNTIQCIHTPSKVKESLEILEDNQEMIYSDYQDPTVIMALDENIKPVNLRRTTPCNQIELKIHVNSPIHANSPHYSEEDEFDEDDITNPLTPDRPHKPKQRNKALEVLGLTPKSQSISQKPKLYKFSVTKSISPVAGSISKRSTIERLGSLSGKMFINNKHYRGTSVDMVKLTVTNGITPIETKSNEDGIQEFALEIADKLKTIDDQPDNVLARRLNYQNKARRDTGHCGDLVTDMKRIRSAPTSPIMSAIDRAKLQNSYNKKLTLVDTKVKSVSDLGVIAIKSPSVNYANDLFKLQKTLSLTPAPRQKRKMSEKHKRTRSDIAVVKDAASVFAVANEFMATRKKTNISPINTLVSQGFYSRTGLNSMRQLKKYECDTIPTVPNFDLKL